MKLQAELENYIKCINENREKILNYAKAVKESGCFQVYENRLAYDVFRFYWQVTYKESTYASAYNKYDCNDNHILTLAKAGLKKANII